MIARLLGVWAPLATVIIPVVILCSHASIYAQVNASDAAFERALRLVVDTAEDDFADLRGELSAFTLAERWDVLVALPGFDKCYLIHEPAARYARDRFWYRCDLNSLQGGQGFANLPELEEKYRRLLAVVEHSTGWPSTDNDQQAGPGKIFHAPGPPPQSSILVNLWFGTLSISVFPPLWIVSPRPGAPVEASADSENRIRKEVKRLESAAVAPLPAPLISNRASSGTSVVRTVDNQTSFVLVMLLTGPIDKRVVLPAGTKQAFEIPAGLYKVAARLLDPDFPILFANQEYTSGHDYRSDFVIERNLVSSHSVTDAIQANSDGASQIRKEVERIESASDVSPLPAPLASNGTSSGSSVRCSVHNQTAYVLTVLLTGPIDKRVVVPPRIEQTFEVPAGRYKVGARLAAPDFPPLFGIHEYVTGHAYRSDFVIEEDSQRTPEYSFIGGQRLIWDGKFAEALKYFEEATRLIGNDYELYIGRGNAHYNLNQFQEAVEDYTQAMLIHPSDIRAYSYRALAREKLGDKKRAKADRKAADTIRKQREEMRQE